MPGPGCDRAGLALPGARRRPQADRVPCLSGHRGISELREPGRHGPLFGATQVFSSKLTGLTGGVPYTFGARAYNATGEEANTTTVTVTAVATTALAVTGLSGSATP